MKLQITQFWDPEPEKEITITGYTQRQGIDVETEADTINPEWIDWSKRQVSPEYGNFGIEDQKQQKFYRTEPFKRAIDFYNAHRLRYKGFVSTGYNSIINQSLDVGLSFHGNGNLFQIMIYGDVIYQGLHKQVETSTELFELICKENQIKLELI